MVKSSVPPSVVSTLYTVVGIMFSVGIGLIVSFNLQGVRNVKFIRTVRGGLNKVRNWYIALFAISTVLFVFYEYFRPVSTVAFWDIHFSFNLSALTSGILLYSIFYFIINFLSIQKLSYDVFDEVNKK